MLDIKKIILALMSSGGIAFAADPFLALDGKWDLRSIIEAYSKPISEWPKPTVDKAVKYKEMESVKTLDSATLDSPIVKLGLRLFHEPRLSMSNDLSCASCHRPNRAYTEESSVSSGFKGLKGGRNAPTILGVGGASSLFWDGRAKTLQEQALGPIANPVEMAMPLDKLAKKLEKMSGYEKDIKEVFGDSTFTVERVAVAIAAYEATIVAPRTRYDEFLDGNKSALNSKEVLGLHLYRTKAQCMNCHYGERLTDDSFHNLGLTYFGRKYHDAGRYEVTKDNNDTGKFKTPTLRQISNTSPYMHNGLFKSLRNVLNMYNGGMFHPKPMNEAQAKDPKFPKTSELIKKLNLTKEELDALEAFLKTL